MVQHDVHHNCFVMLSREQKHKQLNHQEQTGTTLSPNVYILCLKKKERAFTENITTQKYTREIYMFFNNTNNNK